MSIDANAGLLIVEGLTLAFSIAAVFIVIGREQQKLAQLNNRMTEITDRMGETVNAVSDIEKSVQKQRADFAEAYFTKHDIKAIVDPLYQSLQGLNERIDRVLERITQK